MRYVLLDRITELAPPERAVGIKCVSLSDDVFADHFPGLPVMPGALVLEALAQLGGVLAEATMRMRGHASLYAVLSLVEKARFRHPVRPGDQLDLEVVAVRMHELGAEVHGTARVRGAAAVDADITFGLVEIHDPRVVAHRRELLEVWTARWPEPP
jgi:3-hydroxyacyl-[acyl-carrier-protein] dehydratase